MGIVSTPLFRITRARQICLVPEKFPEKQVKHFVK
jgi:hypothetical protein